MDSIDGIAPATSVPVDIISHKDYITTSIPHNCLDPPPTVSPVGLQARLDSLLPWQQALLSNVEHHCPLVNIVQHMSCPFGSTSKILSATDDGAKNSVASYAWTIRLDDVDIVSCHGPVSGPTPCSYRAVCYVIPSLLLYLHLATCDQPAPALFSQMTVHLDCQSLLTKLHLHQDRQYFTPHEAISSECDVLMQIEALLDVLTVSFAFKFVKGHQDNDKAMDELDSPALANIHADSLASPLFCLSNLS